MSAQLFFFSDSVDKFSVSFLSVSFNFVFFLTFIYFS